MSKEVLVSVEGVSKKFSQDLKTGLKYGLQDLFSNVLGRKGSEVLRPKEFWAVKDISFELRRGECIGLIGHNGAGKSTLLKMLNGLIMPDTGSITMKGRIGALIELGAGFNPILSGRENIYNNGAVLGFTRDEIKKKLDTVIEFAELQDFIDMPVQHYSSGMKVRLGFAVAAQMEPDILLIDEILAVGDLGFVLKCLKTIDTILPKTAIIFVSHSMPMVSRICSHIILMNKGTASYQGNNVSKGIDLYYNRFSVNGHNVIFDDGSINLSFFELVCETDAAGTSMIHWKDDFQLKLGFELLNTIELPMFFISIYDKEQRPVAVLEPNNADSELKVIDKHIQFTVEHKQILLSKGLYSIDITVARQGTREPLLRINNLISFQVIHENQAWEPFYLDAVYKNLT